MGRRVEVDDAAFERRAGESFQAWRVRLHDEPVFLRSKAETSRYPHRVRYLFDRAAAIERGRPVPPYHLADETGIYAG
jgi:hypothetical protein